MTLFRRFEAPSVSERGARAGTVLRGASRNNEGLQLQVAQEQPRGDSGPIQGSFRILDPGTNKHSEVLASLGERPTDAATVLRLVRQKHPGCVSPVNMSILLPEPPRGQGAKGPSGRREGVVSDPDQYPAEAPARGVLNPGGQGAVSNPDF